MEFVSNSSHSDNAWSSLSGIIFSKLKEEDGKDDDGKDNDDEDDDKGNDDDSDDDNEVNATLTPPSNKKCKYNTITPGDDNNMAKSNMAKSYPHLV